MSHPDFVHLLNCINDLSAEQMRQLSCELEAKLAEAEAEKQSAAVGQATPAHKPIWEVFQEISAGVPDEVWESLPPDLSEQHVHYIYGTPKRPAE
jgi:hypothetical protein